MLYDKILEIILDYIMYIAILYHILYILPIPCYRVEQTWTAFLLDHC